jgi:hypothetical protein
MINIDPFDLAVEESRKRTTLLFLGGFANADKTKSKVTEYIDKSGHYEALIRLCDDKGNYLAFVYITSSRLSLMPEIHRVYSEEDVEVLEPILKEAGDLWYKRVEEYLASGKKEGTCVLGAGFEAYRLTKGKRKPEKVMIVKAPRQLTQGSLAWEASKNEILNLLHSKKVDSQYK